VPDRVIVIGEFVALLVTVTLPDTATVDAGVNVMLRVAVFPAASIKPVETPLGLKPAPAILTFEIVTFEFPAFVSVTLRTLLLPILTFPKLRLVALLFSKSVAAFTVRVAALLVMLPTLLVTVTVNCAPLSEVAVAGVVYVAEVAPLIAVPPFFHW
jgi:hypothetical protein